MSSLHQELQFFVRNKCVHKNKCERLLFAITTLFSLVIWMTCECELFKKKCCVRRFAEESAVEGWWCVADGFPLISIGQRHLASGNPRKG